MHESNIGRHSVRAYLRLDVCKEQWTHSSSARSRWPTKLAQAGIEALGASPDEREQMPAIKSYHCRYYGLDLVYAHFEFFGLIQADGAGGEVKLKDLFRRWSLDWMGSQQDVQKRR